MKINFKGLGARVRKVREQAGVTQAEFAHQLGVTAHYVSSLERGVKAPSETLLLAILFRFDIEGERWLFSGRRPNLQE